MFSQDLATYHPESISPPFVPEEDFVTTRMNRMWQAYLPRLAHKYDLSSLSQGMGPSYYTVRRPKVAHLEIPCGEVHMEKN